MLAFVLAWSAALPAAAGGAVASPAPEPTAAGDCSAAVAARVQARYDGVQDLAAHFRQRTLSPALSQTQVATGTVVFAKPGKMRWTYETPEPSIVVSDGHTLWMVDPEFKEVQVLPVGEGFLSGTAIDFLLGEGRIDEAFVVSARGCAEPIVDLHLVPREEATYAYLELRVDARSGDLRGTALEDLLGNHTEVWLDDVRTNQAPSPDAFVYVPSEEERVLRLAP